MENRSNLSTILILCGTLLIVSALVLVGYLNALASADVRDHRIQSANLLRDSSIEKVTLSEWEPPVPLSAYATIAGGFWLIHIGIRKALSRSSRSSRLKQTERDELA